MEGERANEKRSKGNRVSQSFRGDSKATGEDL
jgi:hypothetical protein